MTTESMKLRQLKSEVVPELRFYVDKLSFCGSFMCMLRGLDAIRNTVEKAWESIQVTEECGKETASIGEPPSEP